MADVSVVLTVLNEASTIEPLLEDLRAQDQPAAEIVIVDGGSTDGTPDVVRSRGCFKLISLPGSNISEGRNRGISEARSEIVAVTDAGVRLEADWLRLITAPLMRGDADLVAGFFRSDPRSPFERAMGATVLPVLEDVNPATFLPSSRSIAFRKDVWRRVGGYPEWLDYCEDLVFDLNVRHMPDVRVAFEPRAVVRFRPRSSLRAFFRQYYRYARGDGKADLWRKRHAMRYASYAHLLATLVSLAARRYRAYFLLTTLFGTLAYLRKPALRLGPGALPKEYALLPLIRLTGDVAKMLGYPVGWAWRIRHQPKDWRLWT